MGAPVGKCSSRSARRAGRRACARRRLRPLSMFTSTRPSSQSYHVATVTGDPSGRTVPMTAGFGFARKASSSGGTGGPGTRPSLPPAESAPIPCQATPPPTHRCSPERRRTCRQATPGATRSSGTASARSPACRAMTCRLWSRNGKSLDAKQGGVAAALPAALTHSDCVLDGELCAFDESGAPSFELFQRGEGNGGVRRLRRARDRRRAGLRRAVEPEARAAGEADPAGCAFDRALAGLRRRRGPARSRPRARTRGRHGQARERALPAGPPQRRLAQDQDPPEGDDAHRRLHGRRALAQQPRRAAARNRRPGVRRELRQRAVGCRRARAARRARPAAPRQPRPARRGAGRRCRPLAHHLGRAVAQLRGGVHRVDARAPAARARLRAARQARARAQVHEPGQDLLPRGEDHQGRPPGLLPRGRTRARAAPARAADHARPLPRRHHGQALLPEAAATARSGLDALGRRSRAARAGAARRSTTS